MYITNTTSKNTPAVTNSGFSAVTISFPEIQKIPQKDLFILPTLKSPKKEDPIFEEKPEKEI